MISEKLRLLKYSRHLGLEANYDIQRNVLVLHKANVIRHFFVVIQLSSRQQDENEAHSFNKCSLGIKQHVIEWVVLMGYNGGNGGLFTFSSVFLNYLNVHRSPLKTT